MPDGHQSKFDQLYSLRADQVLLRIKPPFVDGRMDFYRTVKPHQAKALPHGPATMFLKWRDGQLVDHGMVFGKGGRNLEILFQAVLNIFPQDIEGDVSVLSTELSGDFIFRPDATETALLSGLEEIIADELRTGIRLTLRQVDSEVVILEGKWQYKPVDDVAERRRSVEHFGRDLNVRREGNGGGYGDAQRWAKDLGRCINRTVIVEGEGIPENICWRHNDRGDDSEESRQLAHDPQLVLQHIHEQTGLISSVQNRMVRRLFVERSNA